MHSGSVILSVSAAANPAKSFVTGSHGSLGSTSLLTDRTRLHCARWHTRHRALICDSLNRHALTRMLRPRWPCTYSSAREKYAAAAKRARDSLHLLEHCAQKGDCMLCRPRLSQGRHGRMAHCACRLQHLLVHA